MKQLLRIIAILGISLLGELLSACIPLPIPASVYGLLLMLFALCTGLIPWEPIQKPGRFLIEIMPIMFIPAAVGLIDSWETLAPMLLPVTATMVVSTFVVMAVTGHVTQAVIRRERRRHGKEDAQ